MVTEGIQFPWRPNRSTISANSELVWEMSVRSAFAGRQSGIAASGIGVISRIRRLRGRGFA